MLTPKVMKYLFSNLYGSFVLDASLQVIDTHAFSSLQEYQQKEKAEQKLCRKYPDLKPLPEHKAAACLANFRDTRYHAVLRQQNLELTRQELKQSVHEDQLIIQAIATIGELDKSCNLLGKRLREWYGLYCPEISHAITDHERFIELIQSKKKAELLKELKRPSSMGADLEKQHVQEIMLLAKELQQLYMLRKEHEQYLKQVMQSHCPNLLELAGTTLGAKLLELGKGSKHLALLPASTIQLLGAEKALFRHLKTGSRSPKYGILYQHPLVQQAEKELRGKAARMLADKLSLCARLDYFKGEFKAKEYREELEGKLRGLK